MMHALLLASFLTPIEDALRHVLNWLHDSVGLTWAWSIVGLTVIVRMLLVPLTVRQIHSMQNLQRHAPQMKEIQRKYKADKKRQQEELMKFYRENNINRATTSNGSGSGTSPTRPRPAGGRCWSPSTR